MCDKVSALGLHNYDQEDSTVLHFLANFVELVRMAIFYGTSVNDYF